MFPVGQERVGKEKRCRGNVPISQPGKAIFEGAVFLVGNQYGRVSWWEKKVFEKIVLTFYLFVVRMGTINPTNPIGLV